MKRLFLSVLVLFFTVSLAIAPSIFAAEPDKQETAKIETLKGDIIDSHCADANKGNLAAFVKTHSKECVLMPDCRASGYNLYTSDGRLLKFDRSSNEKIAEFLKKQESKLQVMVKVKKVGDELSLISIENQK